jgi:hypothetical protein
MDWREFARDSKWDARLRSDWREDLRDSTSARASANMEASLELEDDALVTFDDVLDGDLGWILVTSTAALS